MPMKLHLEDERGVVDTIVVGPGMEVKVTPERRLQDMQYEPQDPEIPLHVQAQAVAEAQEHGSVVCQFSCEHDCTLVGHAYEAMRFLNQCIAHGIVKSAVEGDPHYGQLLEQIRDFRMNHHMRNPEKPPGELPKEGYWTKEQLP